MATLHTTGTCLAALLCGLGSGGRAATAPVSPWQSLNPGGLGEITAVLPDPQGSKSLYALSEGLGLFRTDSSGKTWQFLSAVQFERQVLALAVDPSQSGRLYAGTLNGLEISTNGGRTWERRKTLGSPVGEPVGLVHVHPSDPSLVFAAPAWGDRDSTVSAAGGILHGTLHLYMSRDRGVRWQRSALSPVPGYRQVFSLLFVPSQAATLYLATDAGIFVSRDTGLTFETLPLPASAAHCRGAALSPDGKNLYAFFGTAFDASRDPGSDFRYVTATHLFATPLSGSLPKWQDLTPEWGDTAHAEMARPFWKPRLDPQPPTNSQRLLFAPAWGESPLYLGDAPASGGPCVATLLLQNRAGVTPRLPQPGWENRPSRFGGPVLVTSASKGSSVYVGSRETLYQGPMGQAQLFVPATTRFAKAYPTPGIARGDTTSTYASIGLQAVSTRDVADLGAYVAQIQRGHGLLES